ncbi:hypothetical protein, partial [Nocardioides sp.]|uniref:hypothetical protein n=1 Tax=Nocardioides sp. TaxID=35761 RepID=UPI002632A309
PRATTDPGEGVGLVTPEADPGEPGSAQQQPRRTVRVRLVEAGAGTAAFAVRATPLPAEVRLVVRGRAGLRVVRHLVVRDPGGRDVVIQGLGPGSYTWSATSESASAVSGALSLAPPEVEQVSSPETSASETDEVTPVAATASQEPTSTAPPTTPTPAPTPTPTSSPTPHPSPSPPHGSTATPTDPGTLAPDPVG